MRKMLLLPLIVSCAQAFTVVDNTLINISVGPTTVKSLISQANNGKIIHIRPGLSYSVGIGVRRASGFGFMAHSGYKYNRLERSTSLDIHSGHIHSYDVGIDAMYHLAARYTMNPYFAVGAGLSNTTSSVNSLTGIHKEKSDTQPVYYLGGGIEFRLDKHFGIDTQVRHQSTKIRYVQHHENHKDSLSRNEVRIGLQYAI